MVDEKAILQILHETIKVDASGLAPAVVAHRIEGYEQAAKRILQALSPGSTGETEGWRDIESAPKDGTKFDAWVPDAFGGHRLTGLSIGPRGNLRQDGSLTSADLPRWPTHWRPLPAPPSAMLSAAGER